MGKSKVARRPKPRRATRRFRILFARNVGGAWAPRTTTIVTAGSVAQALAPMLRDRMLSGASIVVELVK